MGDAEWRALTIIASVLFGGAGGAIITALVTTYRNRTQPIGYRIDSERVFNAHDAKSSLKAELAITFEGMSYTYNNLFLVEMVILNKGNVDRKDFQFGIALNQPGYKIINLEHSTPDRHHQLVCFNEPTPSGPTTELDFELKPLNRGNAFSLKMFVVGDGAECLDADLIRPTTAEPVVFILAPSTADLMRTWMETLSESLVESIANSVPAAGVFLKRR